MPRPQPHCNTGFGRSSAGSIPGMNNELLVEVPGVDLPCLWAAGVGQGEEERRISVPNSICWRTWPAPHHAENSTYVRTCTRCWLRPRRALPSCCAPLPWPNPAPLTSKRLCSRLGASFSSVYGHAASMHQCTEGRQGTSVNLQLCWDVGRSSERGLDKDSAFPALKYP